MSLTFALITYFFLILTYFKRVRKISKSDYYFVTSVCPSVRPRGAIWLPLDGFLLNLVLNIFRISVEIIPSFITM